jgi:hypothetical protein
MLPTYLLGQLPSSGAVWSVLLAVVGSAWLGYLVGVRHGERRTIRAVQGMAGSPWRDEPVRAPYIAPWDWVDSEADHAIAQACASQPKGGRNHVTC